MADKKLKVDDFERIMYMLFTNNGCDFELMNQRILAMVVVACEGDVSKTKELMEKSIAETDRLDDEFTKASIKIQRKMVLH